MYIHMYICMYEFGNNTYSWRIRRRSNLGNIFREKSASYGLGNTVYIQLRVVYADDKDVTVMKLIHE